MLKTLCNFLLFTALFVASTYADDYKITHLDSEGIKIGDKLRHVGDRFNDRETIHWTKKVKSFRAKNLATSKLKLFSESPKSDKHSSSPQDYYTNLVGLSGRSPFDLAELGEWLTDTFVLESQIIVPTEEIIDDEHYFVLILSDGEGETACRLPVTPGRLVIDASIFEGVETDIVKVSVDYVNVAKKGAYRLTDSMQIILWNESKEVTPERQEE